MTAVANGDPARRIPPLHCVVGLDPLLYLLIRASCRSPTDLEHGTTESRCIRAPTPRSVAAPREEEGVPPDMDLTRLTAIEGNTHVLAVGMYGAGNEGA